MEIIKWISFIILSISLFTFITLLTVVLYLQVSGYYKDKRNDKTAKTLAILNKLMEN